MAMSIDKRHAPLSPQLDSPKRQRLALNHNKPRLRHDDYTVGWIAALPLELAAAKAMLDMEHPPLGKHQGDNNTYTLGSIGCHNVAIAVLPEYGTEYAAAVGGDMKRTFPCIDVRLMVGIAGGIPETEARLRLGDIVIGKDVIADDKGKIYPHGFTRTLNRYAPPDNLRTAYGTLMANRENKQNPIPELVADMLRRNPGMESYGRPEAPDGLFMPDYHHEQGQNDCSKCDLERLARWERPKMAPEIFLGTVASGNQVKKDAGTRQNLARELGAMCVEMESAGLVSGWPCLAIRGICDYADSHKNKAWQRYAAATAAACAKELLLHTGPPEKEHQKRMAQVSEQSENVQLLRESLEFEEIYSRQETIVDAYSKTCSWLQDHPLHAHWLDPSSYPDHHGFFWIKGKPGVGKSTMMKFLFGQSQKNEAIYGQTIGFFFSARGTELERSTMGMYRSLITQLFQKFPQTIGALDELALTARQSRGEISWELSKLKILFNLAIDRLGQERLTCFIDALDECTDAEVQSMVEHFEELGQESAENGSNLFICFSSRHYPNITIEGSIGLTLESEEGHGEDIAKYIRAKLKCGKRDKILQIGEVLLQMGNGVFLWTVLVVSNLNQDYRNGEEIDVASLRYKYPQQLSELFKQILQRDNRNLDELFLCIQWILFAQRPLEYQEFYYAIKFSKSHCSEIVEWDKEQVGHENLCDKVKGATKGLAEVTRKPPTVQFIHESVRDFLIKEKGIYQIFPQYLQQDFEDMSHSALGKQCREYIAKVDLEAFRRHQVSPYSFFETGFEKHAAEDIPVRFPLWKYAVSSVCFHANATAKSLDIQVFENWLQKVQWIYQINYYVAITGGRYKTALYDKKSLRYIFAHRNHHQLLALMLKNHQLSKSDWDAQLWQPMTATLTQGNSASFRVFWEAHAEKNYLQDLIFGQYEFPKEVKLSTTRTVEYRNEVFAKSNLRKEFHNFFMFFSKEKIIEMLCQAVVDSQPPVTRFLLLQGANPNEGKIRRVSNIQKMMERVEKNKLNDKDWQVLEALLTVEDFDLVSWDNHWKMLKAAVLKGPATVVEQLLNRNPRAATAISTSDGRTLLSYAAERGNDGVVKVLLGSRGVNPSVRDRDGQTPLDWARSKGHTSCAKSLLAETARFEAVALTRMEGLNIHPASDAMDMDDTR